MLLFYGVLWRNPYQGLLMCVK